MLRNQNRYGYSNHIMNASCPNSRTIARGVLEDRVPAGLRDRLMAAAVAAAAMRAYVEESNRLKRERRATAGTERRARAEVEKRIAEIVVVIEESGCTRALMEHLRTLEAELESLRDRLDSAIADVPDMHRASPASTAARQSASRRRSRTGRSVIRQAR